MAEHHGLVCAPVLVIDLRTVFRCERARRLFFLFCRFAVELLVVGLGCGARIRHFHEHLRSPV